MSLDTLLQPEDDKVKRPKDESTKNRLNNLKELLKGDPLQLDTNALQANPDDFPVSQQASYVDYTDEKTKHLEFATQVITNIIETYIKFELSPRLKDMKQKDIIKYSKLLLLASISESNLIKLQESVDGGDMSKDMFDSVNKAQSEMRENMATEEKHLDKCEKYWKDYGETYGIVNAEEKIVQEQEVKDDGAKKHIIIDMSKLSETIQTHLQKEKEKNKNQD